MKQIVIIMCLSLYSSMNWGQNEVKQKKGQFSIGIDYVHTISPIEWRAERYKYLMENKPYKLVVPAIYLQYNRNNWAFQVKAHAYNEYARIIDIKVANEPSFLIEDFDIDRKALYVDLLAGYNFDNLFKSNSFFNKITINAFAGLRNYLSEGSHSKMTLTAANPYYVYEDKIFYSDFYTIRPVIQLTGMYNVYKSWSISASYNFVYNQKGYNMSMLHLGVNYAL